LSPTSGTPTEVKKIIKNLKIIITIITIIKNFKFKKIIIIITIIIQRLNSVLLHDTLPVDLPDI